MFYKQSTKKITKQPVIRNGSVLKPKNWKKQTLSFKNTSLFDSLSEIMMFGCNNFKTCRLNCKDIITDGSSKINIYSAVFELVEKANLKNFYSSRFNILLNHSKIINDEIVCENDIYLVTSLLEDMYSINLKTLCKNCNFSTNIVEKCIL